MLTNRRNAAQKQVPLDRKQRPKKIRPHSTFKRLNQRPGKKRRRPGDGGQMSLSAGRRQEVERPILDSERSRLRSRSEDGEAAAAAADACRGPESWPVSGKSHGKENPIISPIGRCRQDNSRTFSPRKPALRDVIRGTRSVPTVVTAPRANGWLRPLRPCLILNLQKMRRVQQSLTLWQRAANRGLYMLFS